MEHGEYTRHKEQSSKGGKQQSPDDGAPKGCILLSTLSKTQCHRHHADDHGERSHQHWRIRVYPAATAACTAGMPSSSCSRAKLTIKIELAVATPMHMTAPVSEGTFNVVRVSNRNQQIPASAPGSAAMMINGSSHDWKLITISR